MAARQEDNFQQCQIFTLPRLSKLVPFFRRWWQFRNRLKRMVKRRMTYFVNVLSGKDKDKIEISASEKAKSLSKITTLEPGDMVRVKSKEEIQLTLNRWNQLKGCSFMEEMWPYCDTTQRVLKRVEKFLDERDYLVKRCGGIVILNGLMCQGTKDFGPCDRSCFFFWREEWLEKISQA